MSAYLAEERKRIMRLLRDGHNIRVIDGRYTDGFVDQAALDELMKAGKVEKFKVQGFSFVRLPKQPAEQREGER